MVEEEKLELIIGFGHQIESTRRKLKDIQAQKELLEPQLESARNGLKELIRVIVESSGAAARFKSSQ